MRSVKVETNHCGSELARDSGGSACIDVECAFAIASKLAPTVCVLADRYPVPVRNSYPPWSRAFAPVR
ncbi:hypothetical protein FHK92_06620 [Pseudomonas brassicacearum subsp. neoaurantiaca]|uniref:Uncharacterized protein n=1 Tax=Pseudomonas brassicacearum subsp. neoaurantiaca TaxID=494916 RepID=A0A7V8RJ73_9PSED|nr:hypothetical protein [Pseudomonas brassicacearum subsp. neoaurantiaca]